jgi:hypothetical protein
MAGETPQPFSPGPPSRPRSLRSPESPPRKKWRATRTHPTRQATLTAPGAAPPRGCPRCQNRAQRALPIRRGKPATPGQAQQSPPSRKPGPHTAARATQGMEHCGGRPSFLPHGSPTLKTSRSTTATATRTHSNTTLPLYPVPAYALFRRCLRLKTTATAKRITASAPRAIETTAEWKPNIATTRTTTGVMNRSARDGLLDEISRYCCR